MTQEESAAGSRQLKAASGEPPQLRSSTGYLLARLGAESRRRWARMLGVRGLTPHHFGVLMMLDHLGAAHQRRLCELIGIDPRNAVPLIDLLQQRGLIHEANDPADRRRRVIGLTQAGQTMLRDLRRDGDTIERDMLKDLDDTEQAILHRLLLALFESTTRE